jgi:hypothetical protein
MSSSLTNYENCPNSVSALPSSVNDITTDLQPGNGFAARKLTLTAMQNNLPIGSYLVIYISGNSTDYASQAQIAISTSTQILYTRTATGLNTWSNWLAS